MLASPEYAAIKSDYDRISREHFPRDYSCPLAMNFANSDAIFPPHDLSTLLAKEYSEQCRLLCYGSFPAWSEVLSRFEALRSVL